MNEISTARTLPSSVVETHSQVANCITGLAFEGVVALRHEDQPRHAVVAEEVERKYGDRGRHAPARASMGRARCLYL